MRLLPAKASRIAFGAGLAAFAHALIGRARPAIAEDVAVSLAPATQKSALSMVWGVATSPPYVFFVLVVCSILTVTLIIERFMYYRSATGNAEELIGKIKQAGSLPEALTAINNAPGVSQDYIGYGYSQGPVVLALSEGYAMTQSPVLREPLDRALQAVFRGQAAPKTRPQDVGGWRNQSQPNDSDVSVTGWMILALKSARAAGIEIPQPVFEKATEYLWNMYDTKKPGFGYQKPERYPTMTAVGVLCQQFLGNDKDPRIKASLDYLGEQKVDWEKAEGDFVLYGWYYMTQAMFQGGGPYWRYWNSEIRDTMVKNQLGDGRWQPPPHSNIEVRDLARTPAYSTALGALILEVYYRYQPIN